MTVRRALDDNEIITILKEGGLVSITIRIEPGSDSIFDEHVLDENVGQTIPIGGQELTITEVKVIEDGYAAHVTLEA